MNQFWISYYYLSAIVVSLDLFYTIFYSKRSEEAKEKVQEVAEMGCTSEEAFGKDYVEKLKKKESEENNE